MPDTIQHITNLPVYLELINSFPCVVKFTAPWCGPCKKMSPYFEEIAKAGCEKINFIEVDTDEAEEITNYENVQSIPLINFYKNGHKQDDLTVTGFNVQGLTNNVDLFVAQLAAETEKIPIDNLIAIEEEMSNNNDVLELIVDCHPDN